MALAEVHTCRLILHAVIQVFRKIRICNSQNVLCLCDCSAQPQPLKVNWKGIKKTFCRNHKKTLYMPDCSSFWHVCFLLHNHSFIGGIQIKIWILAWDGKHFLLFQKEAQKPVKLFALMGLLLLLGCSAPGSAVYSMCCLCGAGDNMVHSQGWNLQLFFTKT